MSRAARSIPAVAVFAMMAVVALWVLSRPIEDVQASIVGLLCMCILAMAAIPAMHWWLDP